MVPDSVDHLQDRGAVMDDVKLSKDDVLKEAVDESAPKAGERRASSYAERVKRWWNSRLHGLPGVRHE